MTRIRVNPIQLFVLAAAVSLVQCEFKLVVMHTNDMHSRFEETNAHSGPCVKGRGACYGGFTSLKTAVTESRSKAKAEGYNSIFLNAGDTFQGTVYYTFFKWHIVSEMVNMLGFDALSLGNHEFDDGPHGLVPYLVNSAAPIVCANIDYSKEPILASNTSLTKFTLSTVLDIGGVKIGVIGYLTPETMYLSHTGEVKLHDEIPAITKEVKRLKDEGIKILIAVGHSGYPTDKKIAEQVPDLDVVVGGHTNTFLYTGTAPDIEKIEGPYPTVVTQSSGRKVLVVTAYAYTKYLGYLRLTFDDDGEVVHSDGNPILVTESFKKDLEVEKALQKYTKQVKEKAGMKVGKSLTFLEADDKTCRLRECNFGNLVTDAIIDSNAKDFKGHGWTNAPLAFVQGGALRASIDNDLSGGVITYADLMTTMPFTNSVERLVISGEVLIKVLEHSVEGYSPENRPGAFMQFSGMRVDYDLSKSPGKRVKAAMVRCGNCSVPHLVPLDPSHHYHVLTITFLADGGDDYVMLKEASQRTTLSFSDVDAVMNYLLNKSPVHPEIARRITFNGKSDPNTASNISHSVFISILCLMALKILTVPLLD